MSGTISAGGLITGLDSNSIITQLLALERRPITKLQQQITALQAQQSATRDLRTQLLALRNAAQDFKFNNAFNQFSTASSEPAVLTSEVSGTPVIGAYALNVTQLASSTVATSSAKLGAAMNPAATLNSSGISGSITAGTFTINGVQFSVDPATDSLNTLIGNINASSAGVTASYDAVTDKLTISNTTAGNTNLINFGATADTSNMLDILAVNQATQMNNGSGSTTVSSTRNLGAVNATVVLNTASFAGGAVTAGSFQINGISISVDPTTDSLSDILTRINSSGAQVTASYDTSSDTIRVVSNTTGSRTIAFTPGTSNFLSVTNLAGATQVAGNDAQFTINGGAVQTRNANKISDAIGGVTLNLLSLGTSTVTVSSDDDKIVESVTKFIDAYNKTVQQMVTLSGKDGALENDNSIQTIENYLKTTVFSQIAGISGSFSSLVDLGITTGDTFDPSATQQLSLDETEFRAALQSSRQNVSNIFTNTGSTGIADQWYSYLDSVTSFTGFLNDRVKSSGTIDRQIKDINDQITRKNAQIAQHETRLRAQFTMLEQIAAQYQSQGSSLSSLASRFGTVA